MKISLSGIAREINTLSTKLLAVKVYKQFSVKMKILSETRLHFAMAAYEIAVLDTVMYRQEIFGTIH